MSFYNFAKGLLSFTLRIVYRIEVKGIENVPKDKKAIICSNHISMLDPIIVGIVCPRKIFFMAKKELFKNNILKFILNKLGTFPVNRGEADLKAIKNALKILKNENILGIFPEGSRMKVESIENAKPGIAMISIKGKSPIVPVYIESNYKFFNKVKVTIGKPIEFDDYYSKKLNIEDYKLLSQKVMKTIYQMRDT